MKREVSRKKMLPAFSIGIGELELLWGRLLALFEKPEDVYSSINIKLPSEGLEFKNIEELKEYSELRGRAIEFEFSLFQSGRHISIRSSSFLDSRPEVRASANTEAWCAGAIETVYSFAQTNKLWYSWFASAPLGWILIIFTNVPLVVTLILPTGYFLDKLGIAAWLFITLTLAILFLAKGKLFPGAVLVFTLKEGFLRQHVGELSLLAAIISIVLTVIGWFYGK